MFKINTNRTQLYLTYRIGKEIFALNSKLVRNVLDVMPNIKNGDNKMYIGKKEVTILDLRRLAKLSSIENTDDTCVIILEIINDTTQFVGLIVDQVLSLVDVVQDQILSPVEINSTYRVDFINGIVKSAKQIIRLVNMNKLLSFADNIKKVHLNNERELVLGF